MLKNSLTLAVSVAINISMKLCFVSVNGPRELTLWMSLIFSITVNTAYFYPVLKSFSISFDTSLQPSRPPIKFSYSTGLCECNSLRTAGWIFIKYETGDFHKIFTSHLQWIILPTFIDLHAFLHMLWQ
jgi:hypothetical protein